MGQAFECAKCGKPVPVTDANSRELTQAERDVRLFLEEEDQPPPPPRPILPVAKPPPTDERAHDDNYADDLALRRMRDFAPGDPRRRPPPAPSPKPPSGAAAAEASRFVQKGGSAGAKVPLCARCHRPFRGPWDQIETEEGTLCHICANKIDNFVLGAAPERPKTGEHGALMQEIARQNSWAEPPPAAADPTDFERRRRYILILGAVAVITITVALLVSEGSLFSAGPAETPRELPQSFAYVAVNALLHVAAYAMAIYFVLVIAQKRPNENLLANIGAVSIVAVLVYAVNFIPFAGYILGLVVVYLFYELSVPYLFVLIVFGTLAEMCTAALAALIFGTMGMLVR